jgi:hypothetical protein
MQEYFMEGTLDSARDDGGEVAPGNAVVPTPENVREGLF